MRQCLKFILFWNDTLHISEGVSVYHQDLKIVHTATGMCQADTADCLLASSQRAVSSVCLTYASFCMHNLQILMMDGKTSEIY